MTSLALRMSRRGGSFRSAWARTLCVRVSGHFIDGGPQGVLYEVALPEIPTSGALCPGSGPLDRLRVLLARAPWVNTVDEAIAWTFGLNFQ